MKLKEKIRSSMYLEISTYIILSLVISVFLFLIIMTVGDKLVDAFYSNKKSVIQNNDYYINELQTYINDNNISSDKIYMLNNWIEDNKQIYICLKVDGKWLIFSDGLEGEKFDVNYDMSKLPDSGNYSVELSDGTAEVIIVGMYSYKAYMIVVICDIILCVIVFFSIFMMLLRQKLSYIEQLCNDINILEGGDLDYKVDVMGRDELSGLAISLNDMRISFKRQLCEIEELTEANREIVTELSHDLRTPLTAVLLYAEILKANKFESDEKRNECIDKIVGKTEHMKKLSDKILEYAISLPNEHVRKDYYPVSEFLGDRLSDFGCYIEEQGFVIDAEVEVRTGSVLLVEEYVTRILDNIASNIIKHADKDKKVMIKTEYGNDNTLKLIVINGLNQDSIKVLDSHGIGLKNISGMMEKMGGKMENETVDSSFRLILTFKYKE